MTFKHKLSRRLAGLPTAAAAAAIIVGACEQPLPTPPAETVAQFVISPKAIAVQPNQDATFMAVGLTPQGDTAQISVTWGASDGSVTDMGATGGRHFARYRSANAGTFKMWATAQPGGKSDTANVTVTPAGPEPVASVDVTPTSASVDEGKTVQLTATPRDASGNPLSGRVVTWTSSNTAVATVSASGLVTAKVAGTATITAASEGRNGTSAITVVRVPVAAVSVTPATASVQAGSTVQLTATPRDASGNPLSGRAISWVSSDNAVATVNGSGLVTGVAAGSATITATSEGSSGSASITVTSVPVPVASVEVTPPSASIEVGRTVQLTATPRDANGAALPGRAVTWVSSNAGVAAVNGSGLVTGAGAGTATITATSEGKSGTSAITVTAPPPPPPGCLVSSVAWQNTAFTSQNGSFTAQFDATPNGTGLDAITGLSQGPAGAYGDLAAIVRFNVGGTIDARNGGAYAAASAIPYTAGTSYRFRLVVDVPTHTYSAYVTPAGGAEVTIGTGYAFRTEQSAVASLANWATYSSTGTHTVCNFSISGSAPPVPVASVDVAPASASVDEGKTVQLTATPKDANGNPLTGRVVSWTSSNTAVATVNASGMVTGVAAGSATITATSEGKSGTSAITVTPAPYLSLAVCQPTAGPFSTTITNRWLPFPVGARTVLEGGNPFLRVEVTSLDQTEVVAGVTTRVVEEREFENGVLVEISRNFVVQAPEGTVCYYGEDVDIYQNGVITGHSGSWRAGVNNASPGILMPGTPKVGDRYQQEVAPGVAMDEGRIVSTGNTVVTPYATFTNAMRIDDYDPLGGGTDVKYYAEGIGNIVDVDAKLVSFTPPPPPPPIPVASVEVTPASASVDEGKTVQLTATPKDANGNPLSGRTITWTSSNTAVATVSSSGLVTGKVAGTATITATSEGVSGTSAITVVRVPVASVSVTPATASVQEGSTVQLTATPRDASGSPLSGRVVTWTSSNAAVATVNGSGLVTGVTAGSATITATSEGQSGTSAVTVTAPPPPGSGVVLVGAGDIAGCSQNNDEATAKLLDVIPGTVFTAGDNAYPDGTDANFAQCYDPTWGRHKARTRPSPGNHDYHTSGAAGYYAYFGANAGPAGRGYFSYDLGDWHIISLNSNISMSAGSAQEQWLRGDLAASTKRCALAYWHHPRFSSGSHGSSTSPRPLWQALYDYNAEVVISGHDHNYQRFAPQTPDGVADPVRGIREFIAGMGGQSHYNFSTPIANTEAYNTNTFGVLKLTLYADRYEWEFVPVAGGTYRDSGSGSCH